jgi:Xaa-Pro dipeptidase
VEKLASDSEFCRNRQQRLTAAAAALGVDWVIVSKLESIQWLTGWRSAPVYAPIVALTTAGHVILIMPESCYEAAAVTDNRIAYKALQNGTLVDDQQAASASALFSTIGKSTGRIACEFSSFNQHLGKRCMGTLVDLEPILLTLRRWKDPDELGMIRTAITANRAMYEFARQTVRPGVCEVELFADLQRVAVSTVGEPPTYFGQDFQCNSRGGSPRQRRTAQRELYILDLGVGYRGYYSDNARTFAIGGDATPEQFRAWQHVRDVFAIVEDRIRPGVRCKPLFNEVHDFLNRCSPFVFDHHLGHGVGLAAHEAPRINPHWDDCFEEGDVIALEPGLYHRDLRAGVRLEQMYRVTAEGVELLSDWTLEL